MHVFHCPLPIIESRSKNQWVESQSERYLLRARFSLDGHYSVQDLQGASVVWCLPCFFKVVIMKTVDKSLQRCTYFHSLATFSYDVLVKVEYRLLVSKPFPKSPPRDVTWHGAKGKSRWFNWLIWSSDQNYDNEKLQREKPSLVTWTITHPQKRTCSTGRDQ